METAPRTNSSRCGSTRRAAREAIAEARHALRLHARRVHRQVFVEGGPVAQPVLHDAADAPRRRARVLEDLRRAEAVELQHVRDVVAQPRVERGGDLRVGLEVDLVDDAVVVLRGLHARKGSKKRRRAPRAPARSGREQAADERVDDLAQRAGSRSGWRAAITARPWTKHSSSRTPAAAATSGGRPRPSSLAAARHPRLQVGEDALVRAAQRLRRSADRAWPRRSSRGTARRSSPTGRAPATSS